MMPPDSRGRPDGDPPAILASGDGTACPQPETLAEYVDGTLDAPARHQVEHHLAWCDDCLEVVGGTAAALAVIPDPVEAAPSGPPEAPSAQTEGQATGSTSSPPWRPRSPVAVWLPAVAAAAVVIAVWRPWTRPELPAHTTPPPSAAVRPQPAPEAGQADTPPLSLASYFERTSPGRLSGFSYAPFRGATRSAQARPDDDPRVLEVASRAQADADREPVPDNLHTWGVAQILIRRWSGAIETLEAAARQRPQDPRLLNDLAVAYLGRGTIEARDEDLLKALETAERALAVDRGFNEALFNRGVALDALGRATEAQSAFRALLARDRSTWRGEVERRLGDRPARR